MCGIIGIFNSKDVKDQLATALKVMQARGQDASNTFIKENAGIGHNLHAIVNYTPQPLNDKFVTNCEIYNWEALNEKHDLKAENDADLLLKLLEKNGTEALSELDGVYALCLWEDNKVLLARDILGIKPIWYTHNRSFAFASEKKALEAAGFLDIHELNPRQLLTYDQATNTITLEDRDFFTLEPIHQEKEKVKQLLIEAIKKRIPKGQKVGLLFSGGVDSTFIGTILKNLNIPFTCYTAAIVEETMKEAEDLTYAKKAAELMDLDLNISEIKVNKVSEYLKTIVPLIEDSNVVKVGVALPFYVACKAAKKDGVRVIFSGLGSEEIFAGYERHIKSANINEECLYGLKQMYQRDLYRDDVVTMHHSIELRLPFLDKELVQTALNIDPDLKITKENNKAILREIAKELGTPHIIADRKKKAAQYGSKFDKALAKLAKREGKNKSGYLRQFYPTSNLKVGALFSSGKDSTYALYIMQEMNYEISCLITLESDNKSSYMFHTPNIELTKLQSESLDIPRITQKTKGEKEVELEDLEKAIKKAKEEYKLDAIVTGAIFSTYQRNRIETICDKLGLSVFAPLWHKNQEEEMREIITAGFKVMLSSIAAYGLTEEWLGKVLTLEDVDKLALLEKKYKINVAGEGGEFESLVVDGPNFSKSINITKSKVVMEDENTGNFIIEEAHLK